MKYRRLHILTIGALLSPVLANADESWDFTMAPYLWFTGLEGNVSTLPNAPIIPIDLGTADTDEALKALSMVFEAKKGRHGVIAELLYFRREEDGELIPPIGLTVDAELRNTMHSIAYEYALVASEKSTIDAFVGARYWKVDTKLEFEGGLGILAGQAVRNAESWYDPLIGIKGRTRFGNSKFFGAVRVVAGGFGVGSEDFYDVSANVGYQFSEKLAVSLGFREFDVEYEEGDFFYDIKQTGWGLGLIRSF